MKKFLTGVALILVVIFIWNSDWFNKEFFPKEYWSKQVTRFESLIVMDEAMIRDTAIEIKKLQLTASLQIAQEINSAKSIGLSTEEAKIEAVEMLKMDIKNLREDIQFWKEMLKKDTEQLEEVSSRLEQAQ